MNLPTHIHTVFLTLIIIHVIACGGYKSKNYKEILVTKLLNVINSSDVDTYIVSKNGRLKRVNSKYSKKVGLKDLFHNRVLVKRLVPHGYGVSGYEYDGKFNTIFKPLVRVHGGKPRFSYEGKGRTDYTNRGENKRPRGVRNVHYRDEELLQPFHHYIKPKTVTFKSILEDVQSYVRKYDSTTNMKKLKYAILGLLENYPKYHLRHRFTTGSDERAMENAMTKFDIGHEEMTEKPKKKHHPVYPYWNYWTYDKGIYQDVCKGKLLQLGNLCVKTPPH